MNQCKSCGGFCKKSGCERQDVRPQSDEAIKAAVLQERERCAAICDIQIASGQLSKLEIYRARFIADAIRNQGKTNDT